MKKFIFILLSFYGFAYAKLNIVVSILPQQAFLKQIAGDKVGSTLMVKPGSSPHTYEPKPSQMIDISKADIYLAMGVEFENVWLKKFKDQNKNMKIINCDSGIEKMDMVNYGDKHDHHHHDHHAKDPHIWTTPSNTKKIAENIYNSLIKHDKTNKQYYEQNYKKFIAKIDQTDMQIKTILKGVPKKSKFMVFHPSWGYFAKQYDLVQIAVEVEGKSPNPKALTHIIKKAKQENIKAIFVSPEFSPKMAQLIAKQLNIEVVKISPLNPNWSQNLLKLAKAIAK